MDMASNWRKGEHLMSIAAFYHKAPPTKECDGDIHDVYGAENHSR